MRLAAKSSKSRSNIFIESAQLDATMIRIEALGGNLAEMSDSLPLWHAEGVPTYYGAKVIAEAAGIEVETKNIEEVPLKLLRYPEIVPVVECRAIVWLRGSIVASAGISRDPEFGCEIAVGLAFRNAVQRKLCDPLAAQSRRNKEVRV